MFRKDCVRNSFLIKSCRQLPVVVLQRNISEIFFNHIESSCKEEEIKMIENLQKHEEKSRFGYGKIEVENLLKSLISEDIDEVSTSLNLLCNELKNPIKIKIALDMKIVEILAELFRDFKSTLKPTLMPNIHQLLEILATHHEASSIMIANETLMKSILYSLTNEDEMSSNVASILMKLSQDLFVAENLLLGNNYVAPALIHLFKKPPTNKSLYESLANFISRKPNLFATDEVFKALTTHFWDFADQKVVSGVLKCFALVVETKDGIALAEKFSLLPKLLTILLNEQSDEEVLTYGIMLMKNCMLNESSFYISWIQWTEIIELLIQKSYTKHHKLLQQVSIQALRVISDKASVKDELRKKYKVKVRKIPCLGDESQKLKDDLVQWLEYRNFKSNDLPKYSKLFI